MAASVTLVPDLLSFFLGILEFFRIWSS